MNSLAPSTTTVNERSTTYSRKAGATRSRRAKAGRYATAEHKAAFERLMVVGAAGMTTEELETLGTHPYLTVSQRAAFAKMAVAA